MRTMSKSIAPNQTNGHILAHSNLGSVYTPTTLAEWVAGLFIEFASLPSASVVCDPSCGDGELLRAVFSHAPQTRLLGIDLDPSAVNAASNNLKNLALFKNCNALMARNNRNMQNWSSLFESREIHGVIANPPWGADLNASRGEFAKAGYNFAKGQFDIWNLFIEATLHNLASGGTAAFIVPDAIFLPEHERIRRYLHNNTRIKFVARLGEGFFPDVFRGTTVLVFQKSIPQRKHKI